MASRKIKRNSFDGDGGLKNAALAIRELSQYLAAGKVAVLSHPAITNSTGGTVGSALTPLVVPEAPFNTGGQTTGAQQAGSATLFGTHNNALAVLMDSCNDIRAVLDMPARGEGNGTIAIADTVPALGASVTGVATDVLDFAVGRREMVRLVQGARSVAKAIDEVRIAVGLAPMAGSLGGPPNSPFLTDLTNLDTSSSTDAPGTSGVSKAVVDAFAVAFRDSAAFMAVALQDVVSVTQGNLPVVAA